MGTTGIYIRVSTFDQEDGLKSQEHAIREYLRGHGIDGVEWYRDRLSGATTKRPAFERLQRDIFAGKVKTVICWKLDRLSRSIRDGINVLCDWLEKNVRVVAISQQLDFSGPMGKAFAVLLFALAEMERDNLRENTKRGMAAAKKRGARLGKRPKLFAADIVPMLKAGDGISDVAKTLGKSRMAIYNALRRGNVDLSEITNASTMPAPAPKTKISQLQGRMAAGDWRGALRIAKGFHELGPQKTAICRAWAAIQNPETYREMGKDPQALIDAGIEALRERYGAGVAAGK